MHALGLTSKQAQGIAEWNNTQIAQAAQAKQIERQREQAASALKREWGNEYDRNLTLGDRAAQEFGFTEDMVRAMAHGMGHKPTLEILARIGRGLTEHSYEGGADHARLWRRHSGGGEGADFYFAWRQGVYLTAGVRGCEGAGRVDAAA